MNNLEGSKKRPQTSSKAKRSRIVCVSRRSCRTHLCLCGRVARVCLCGRAPALATFSLCRAPHPPILPNLYL